MDYSILEKLLKRCVFCNPNWVRQTKSRVKANDITVLPSKEVPYMAYIATPDVECRPSLTSGFNRNDFINNEFTVICDYTFH